MNNWSVELSNWNPSSKDCDQMIAQVETRHHKHPRRHHSMHPEQAIRWAKQENLLYFGHGLRILGATIVLCLLCWGGVVLFDWAQHYLTHEGNGFQSALTDQRP